MFVHSVYFWLKDGLTQSEIQLFKTEVQALAKIETVKASYIGRPSSTDRPVIDSSYSYGMVLVFDDKQGHDIYQDHEVHDRFRNECSVYWSKVLIYDFE
jgi:hypothetical protein